MSLFEKLSKVQAVLKAPKSQLNKFGGYKYRSKEDILEAAKPLCIEHGLVLAVTDEVVLIGERYYVKSTAVVIDIKSGDKASSIGYAREAENKKGMDAAQITGAAASYAGKYALGNLFAIDDLSDSDATSDGKGDAAPKKAAPAPAPKLKEVTAQVKSAMLKSIGEGKFAVVEKKLAGYADSENKKAVVTALTNAKQGK
jgi:hypothetical protein